MGGLLACAWPAALRPLGLRGRRRPRSMRRPPCPTLLTGSPQRVGRLRRSPPRKTPPTTRPRPRCPQSPSRTLTHRPPANSQAGSLVDAAVLREAYLEGEMEALGQAAREIPAGTAMGAYLQEVRASGERRAVPAVLYRPAAGWRWPAPARRPPGRARPACCWRGMRVLHAATAPGQWSELAPPAPPAPLHPPTLPPTHPPAAPPEDGDQASGVDYHSLARQHVASSGAGGAPEGAVVAVRHAPLVVRAVSTIFQVGGCGWPAAMISVLVGDAAGRPGLRPYASLAALTKRHPTLPLCIMLDPPPPHPTPATAPPPAHPLPPAPQYMVGLIVGAFQAVVVLFYQWVVDPAEHGTWCARRASLAPRGGPGGAAAKPHGHAPPPDGPPASPPSPVPTSHAPPGPPPARPPRPVRFFTYLTTGPLKGAMLQFFADSTNFSRR